MNWPDIYTPLRQLTTEEVLGFLTSAAGVWLAIRQKVWTWPVSLAGVLLSMVVFYRERLLADVALQVFYVGVTSFGWYQWLYGGKQHSGLQVARASGRTILLTLAAGVVLSPAVGLLFDRFTPAEVPYLDSALAVFSGLTTILMSRKLIEHWLFWIVIDLLYTGLYFYKGLYLYSLLFLVFTGMAVQGYRSWRLSLNSTSVASSPG